MTHFFRGSRINILLILIILAMGAEIIYLVCRNRELQSIIDDPRNLFTTLTQDDIVPAISAQDIYGRDISLRYYAGAPYTLLLWFGPTCKSCGENIGVWNRIFRERDSTSLRVIGMCAGNPDEARNYVEEYGLEFPVISARDRHIVEVYKGNVLPQTVVVSPEGKILGVWPGALDFAREEEVIGFLGELE
jgi:peroxiredoxin